MPSGAGRSEAPGRVGVRACGSDATAARAPARRGPGASLRYPGSRAVWAALAWPVRRPEEEIPEAEHDAEILGRATLVGRIVVPQVHARVVEDVAQPAEIHVDVAVVEIAPDRRRDRDGHHRLGRGAQPDEGEPLECSVDHDLQPVEAPVAHPVHRRDRVVHLVERPQPWHPMQQVVDAPLKEIGNDQQDQELEHEGPMRDR